MNMEAECKCKWSRVLKPAVLIMNSTRKRSTKYTREEENEPCVNQLSLHDWKSGRSISLSQH